MASWTRRQRMIMREVMRFEGAGAAIDIDDLIAVLRLSATKQALQCSIRILEERGVLVRDYQSRRGRRRMVLGSTALAVVEFAALAPALRT